MVGPWGARFAGRTFPCAIGRGGIVPAEAKREGDGATPAGSWRLLRLWWRADRRSPPRTRLPAAPAGPSLGWADDPADPAYNRPVPLPYRAGAERMARADRLYDIVVATDHNAFPTVPGMGSAIFLHCWRGPRVPTAGCVALAPRDLARVLALWRPWNRLVVRGVFPQGAQGVIFAVS